MERDSGQGPHVDGEASALGQRLRLVGAPDAIVAHRLAPTSGAGFATDRSIAAPRRVAEARRSVARENVEAAHERTLDPCDPRWQVALEAARQMQGPLLTFERRRTVLALAHRVGVRPFDTHLIIAAVQDRARRGERLVDAMPVVALTQAPERRPRTWIVRMFAAFWPYAIVAGVAAAAHAAIAYWLLGPTSR